MDTKLSIKEIEEMIISNEVSLRNEIAITNLSWGMLPYEADLVVIKQISKRNATMMPSKYINSFMSYLSVSKRKR